MEKVLGDLLAPSELADVANQLQIFSLHDQGWPRRAARSMFFNIDAVERESTDQLRLVGTCCVEFQEIGPMRRRGTLILCLSVRETLPNRASPKKEWPCVAMATRS